MLESDRSQEETLKKGWKKEYTRGLTWTYKDKSTRVKVVGWANQMYSSILDGWEVERPPLLEMWSDILDPRQEFQLRGWIKKAVSLTCCGEKSCIVLMWELRENSGNSQVTRLSDMQDNEIIRRKLESGNGEELGRELKNLFLKYWAWNGSGMFPRDDRETGQI